MKEISTYLFMVYKSFMYTKDTSQIHLEFDSLNKSSQIHVQRYIHVHAHLENPAGRVVHIIAFAILYSI